MTTCSALSDAMPSVAHGRRAWTADEATHLRQCPDCAGEWRLVLAASQLAAPPGEPANPAELTARVLGRLRTAERRHAQRWVIAGLAAAVLAMGVFGVLSRTSPRRPAGATDAAGLVLPALDTLSEPALTSVLDGLSGPMLDLPADQARTDLAALDSTGLQLVLKNLEGI